jgi:hypothetical protein
MEIKQEYEAISNILRKTQKMGVQGRSVFLGLP